MILWLNQGERYPAHLGVDGDVLRADEHAALLDADATLVRAQRTATEIVAAAREEADALLAAAREAAAQSAARAEERYAASGKLGYAAGLRRALDEAHTTMQVKVWDARQAAVQAQRRLAGVVMKAVEQIVYETNRDALFARIGLTLQRLIDSESYLTLRVHGDDAARARVALQQAAESAGWRGGFDVIVDADAALGSCVCEWDYGVLVTGLDTQLGAIRRALLAQPEEADRAAEAAGGVHGANNDAAVPEGGLYASADHAYDDDDAYEADHESDYASDHDAAHDAIGHPLTAQGQGVR
ncbi:type III secretion system stator protein SctL [Robbsia sp. KACC 23696]|uniref:type III secretion system stator protein SctL n=1 Tax=Robbsia sp. KACC 23696 TaxID=3149231 RepID=UPI00325A94C8